MKKRMGAVSLILSLLLAAAAPATGFAAESGEVAYTGDALVCTGQMSGFSSILPGVEASDTLLLENKSGTTANFYMKTDVLNTLEKAGAAGAGYTVRLTCKSGETTSVLYGYDPATGETTGALVGGRDSQELKELNSQLEGYRLVATLEAGEQAEVTLSLLPDAASLGNPYQASEGLIQFTFQAAEVTPQTETVVNRVPGKTIFTGDYAPIFLLAAAAFIALPLLIILKKKHREEE